MLIFFVNRRRLPAVGSPRSLRQRNSRGEAAKMERRKEKGMA